MVVSLYSTGQTRKLRLRTGEWRIQGHMPGKFKCEPGLSDSKFWVIFVILPALQICEEGDRGASVGRRSQFGKQLREGWGGFAREMRVT